MTLPHPTSMAHISPEDELLLACTRQSFEEPHRQTVRRLCQREAIEWEVVYSTADLHGVAPLVYTNLQRCPTQDLGVPAHIVNRFRLCLARNMLVKDKMASNLANALAFFAERSIDVMLIKGGALDILVYDHPYYTTLNDIDLVLRVRHDEVTQQERREVMRLLHGSGLEYDYYEHHDVVMNGALPVDFRHIWDNAAKISFEDRDVFVMSPEDMLISLCINSCRKRFFRLKSLCDIAETCKHSGLRWTNLIDKAKAYDCQNIVYTALLTTFMTLGCEIPDEVLIDLGVGPIRARVIHFLSQRSSLSAFSSMCTGREVLGRKVDCSLMLPYATFRSYQVWRRITNTLLLTKAGTKRTDAGGFVPQKAL